jgi:hypothetical protein
MSENQNNSTNWSWILKLLVFVFIAGLLFAIIIPNHVGPHTSKLNGIINNLREMDAAKNEWVVKQGLAVKYGFTNVSQFTELTNQPTEQDPTPYLRHNPGKQGDLIPSVAGEIYAINPLNKSPEAKLVRKISMPWPQGSIIRFSGNTNAYLEITFPDGTRTNY